MTESCIPSTAMRQALESGDWDRVEELWLEALDGPTINHGELLEVRRLLWKEGKKTLALTLLELLAESLEVAENHRGALAALKELIRLKKSHSKEDMDRLENSFTRSRSDSPSLREILERHELQASRRPLETIAQMESWLDHDLGTPVEVMGQGVGRVVDLNLELQNVKVDIGTRRPVSVPFGAVSRYLRILPEGDFLRRKVEAPDELATFVMESPGDALVQILDSVGDDTDVAAIKAALENLLPASKWNTWWAKARKHPRVLSSGSGSRLRYSLSGSAESAAETLLDELTEAPPRDRLSVARRLASRGEEAGLAASRFLADSLPELERTNPGLAWETAGILAGLPDGKATAVESRARVVAVAEPLHLLSGITDRAARIEALETIRETRAEVWVTSWGEWLLHEENSGILSMIVGELDGAGGTETLESSLEAIFRNHNAHPAQFVWAAERMTEEDAPPSLHRRMTPSLLEKLPDTLTRKEFSAVRARAKALLDGGQVAIRLLLEAASPQQAERFSQRINRIGIIEPQRVRLIEQAVQQGQGAREEEEAPIFAATPTAIEAKRRELKQLLEVEIPKTLKGINAAAAEGDLRENFEYHMLRDRQELQSAQAAKIQQDLGIVRELQPKSADTSKVNIGTVVHLVAQDGRELPSITILGPWDADVDRRIFASETELAKGLLGHEVGEEVEVEGERATISDISAWAG